MRSHPAEADRGRTGRKAGWTGLRRAVLPLAALMLGVAACAPMPPGGMPGAVMDERAAILAINFDFDSFRIRPDSYAVLDNTAAALQDPRFAYARFEINGHTDITGRFGYNVALSTLRARAVLSYLANRGVPPEKMVPQGFGPLQLFDPANPRSPENRRVEVVVVR